MAKPEKREPVVCNALLRCNREDSQASVPFERISEVPGLWVLELGPFLEKSWSGWLAGAQQTLVQNEPLLSALRVGGTDYTLHVTVESLDITIPPALAQILGACGITMELYQRES